MAHCDWTKNIERQTFCILGLPFDVLTKQEVIEKLIITAANNTPFFLSTPNINFLISSLNDKHFRDSVINSDLSIVDGTPIVWIARLLGIPIPERVAGSDLIDAMMNKISKDNQIKVFFFGGKDDVADTACRALNSRNTGLTCVGSMNPGFVPVNDMSSDEIITTINKSGADFVIVSLGAKKGQEWIQRNRSKINVPIISHLGAVVNFIAGEVCRAPKLLRKCGLEWIWRIKEEPSLWRRYFNDGVALIKLILFNVIPLSILILKNKNKTISTFKADLLNNKKKVELVLGGDIVAANSNEINAALKNACNTQSDINITIRKNSYVDGAFIAKLQLIKNELSKNGRKLFVISKSKLVAKIFYYNCCEYLLNQGEK